MPVPGSDPIIVAPTPNPFRPDESIDHDKLRATSSKCHGSGNENTWMRWLLVSAT